jgi:hypothetical protein
LVCGVGYPMNGEIKSMTLLQKREDKSSLNWTLLKERKV